MNLAGLDLNLLLVFDAVMNERNATRAGERIGMSQPAVSITARSKNCGQHSVASSDPRGSARATSTRRLCGS